MCSQVKRGGIFDHLSVSGVLIDQRWHRRCFGLIEKRAMSSPLSSPNSCLGYHGTYVSIELMSNA